MWAFDMPPNLPKRAAQRETEHESERAHYLYRQTVVVEEIGKKGIAEGSYREVREIVFSPMGERSERVLEPARSTLKRLQLTEEDFRDIREVQPLLLTRDMLWLYQTEYKGEETMDGVPCHVLRVQPRQILQGQRLFDGLLWLAQDDFSVVRSEGQAVPQLRGTKQENLFPHFTTVRAKVDGKHWFPVRTYADDTLDFRTGPIRMRLVVRYDGYRRFGAESSITFDPPQP